MKHQKSIEELGRRLDCCREQITIKAIHGFTHSNWAQMADEMEKAITQLQLCVIDARYIAFLETQNRGN